MKNKPELDAQAIAMVGNRVVRNTPVLRRLSAQGRNHWTQGFVNGVDYSTNVVFQMSFIQRLRFAFTKRFDHAFKK